jgi:tyrosinase
MTRIWNRRAFLRDAALAILAAGVAPCAGAQSGLVRRLDWANFKQGPDYASFMDGLKKMRANTNVGDKRSLGYWANVHENFCPHGMPYFLAWHRGFITLFERQLRAVSGNPALALPYWNYYDDPILPPEFSEPGSWNPLFVDRVNDSVADALRLSPFDATTFQGGLTTAFEQMLEDKPHNPVHDLIGGIFTTMQSPMDPIFFLHHANIDRLWTAWASAGGGREQFLTTDAYWNGSFSYAAGLTMSRAQTANTRQNLGYFYENETMPTSLPGLAAAPQALRAASAAPAPQSLGAASAAPARPPFGSFAVSRMKSTGANSVALGGVRNIRLDRSSVSARILLDKSAAGLLRDMMDSFQRPPFATGDKPRYTKAKVVLSDVSFGQAGAAGGYFYNLYLNLPDQPGSVEAMASYQVGNLGPFKVNVGLHHGHGNGGGNGHGSGARIEFDVTDLLLGNRGSIDLSSHSFSFVRVSGRNAPDGETITIGDSWLELS